MSKIRFKIPILLCVLICMFMGACQSSSGNNRTSVPPKTTVSPQSTSKTPPTTDVTTVPPVMTTAPITTIDPDLYRLDEIFRYPERGNMTVGEWKLACKIPEEVLPEISTKDLLELVLNYPLLGDYGFGLTNFYMFYSRNSAVKELLARSDLKEVLENFDLQKSYAALLGPPWQAGVAEWALFYIQKYANGDTEVLDPEYPLWEIATEPATT